MSGIGTSLADLDKTVRREVPGGWVTVGGLGLGAGAVGLGAGGFSGIGAGASGTSGAAGAAGTIANTTAAMEGAAIASAAAQGTLTEGMIAAAGTGLPAGTATIPTGYAGLSSSMAAELGLSGPSALGTQGASGNVLANVYGASSPFTISPMQAMAMNKAMGGFQQPQGGTQTQTGAFRPGQQVNLADPIASLLAPKRKKERPMISLL